ncbi:MAG TPA: outer membrane beta-barrel protein [Ignavibacteria bacterium]|nr:outer membrane beta-barrel protein [Ignavibacteria bacterium]HMQ99322.1 outer membrane beta-barrel protein [Ignavibacteria bacterium]
MKQFIVLLSALFFAFAAPGFAQSKMNLTLYGGYSLPVADLKGNFPDTLGTSFLDFERSGSLLTSSGFNIGATGKYCVDTLGKARLTAGFNYNSFSGTKDYPRSGATLTYKNKVNIFTISVGAEYGFLPKKKVNPFVGLDLAVNFFSGKIEGSGDSTFTVQRKSESRFGIVVNGGADIKLNKSIGAVVGVKYGLTNLIGKKTEITTTSPLQTDDEETGSSSFRELGLNDEESANNKSKAIYYIQFYAGLSFYFGEMLK